MLSGVSSSGKLRAPMSIVAERLTAQLLAGPPVGDPVAGPFLGDGGAVGGYFIFEADDLDAAIELAARIPAARLGGAIEVRPVGTYW